MKDSTAKLGQRGKMVIKPFSIPEKLRSVYLKTFFKYTQMSLHGCWVWGGRCHNGYGTFPAPDGNSKWAHRVSYALFNGAIEAQMHIDHRCRNRDCVNPAHLIQVTPIENYLAIGRRKRREIKRKQEQAGQLNMWGGANECSLSMDVVS